MKISRKPKGRPSATIGDLKEKVARGGIDSLTSYELDTFTKAQRHEASIKPAKPPKPATKIRHLSVRKTADKILKLRLQDIQSRIESGEKVTDSEIRFVQGIAQQEAAKESVRAVRDKVQLSLEKRMALKREQVWRDLELLVAKSTGLAKLGALKMQKEWIDGEEPPPEPLTFPIIDPCDMTTKPA